MSTSATGDSSRYCLAKVGVTLVVAGQIAEIQICMASSLTCQNPASLLEDRAQELKQVIDVGIQGFSQ